MKQRQEDKGLSVEGHIFNVQAKKGQDILFLILEFPEITGRQYPSPCPGEGFRLHSILISSEESCGLQQLVKRLWLGVPADPKLLYALIRQKFRFLKCPLFCLEQSLKHCYMLI